MNSGDLRAFAALRLELTEERARLIARVKEIDDALGVQPEATKQRAEVHDREDSSMGERGLMKAQTFQFTLSVLLLKESDTWVVQCLQYDIAGQGESIDEAMKSFESAFVGHVILDAQEGVEPLSELQPAPPKYWKWFHRGEQLAKPRPIEIQSEIPERNSLPAHVLDKVPPPWMIRAMAQDVRVF